MDDFATGSPSSCHFIPPYLLQHVAGTDRDVEAARCGHATLVVDEALRSHRATPPPQVQDDQPGVPLPPAGQDAWTIHTADNGSTLPGEPVRSSGEPPSGDVAVDEAYSGVEASLALCREELGRDSYDGRGAPVVATVHYERNYSNAFWDGRQLVFGDGDGKVFERFTKPIDVLGHEFAHALTQHTAGLTYQDQSGALNESVSDVFAAMLKQRILGQTSAEADWLIGEGIFTSAVQGRALRSMSEPGTAYDDPVVGKDPQVGSMADYVETQEDNGGVHINSGIPNRAFHLAAVELGGSSWERAGQIWYAALTSAEVSADTVFTGFADACVAAAAAGYDDAVAAVVRRAWEAVGVLGGAPTPRPAPAPSGGVEVRRTGGFAGMSVSGSADPDQPEVQQLLGRVDFAAVSHSAPQPDRFTYHFLVGDREVTVAEQDLTDELAALARIALDD